MANKVKVTVLSANELKYPDGRVEWRSSSPTVEPPGGKVWHPALGEFVDEGKVEPYEAEIDD